jgi:hypothetical protein
MAGIEMDLDGASLAFLAGPARDVVLVALELDAVDHSGYWPLSLCGRPGCEIDSYYEDDKQPKRPQLQCGAGHGDLIRPISDKVHDSDVKTRKESKGFTVNRLALI